MKNKLIMVPRKYGMSYLARVRLRRGPEWQIKPNAEQLDGKVFEFTYGWPLTEEDTSIYAGEDAWLMPRDPIGINGDAPLWVASGDLVDESDALPD